MKKLKLISLNLIGLFVMLLLVFGLPTFQKVSLEHAEPIMIERRDYAGTEREHPETAEEMREWVTESGRIIRPLTPLPEYDYETNGDSQPAMDNGDEPPEFGESKNGDPELWIVQVINALGNNMGKLMGGLVALSQALLNFRIFRNRKKENKDV